ncbi:MAG: hypothetical protein J6Y32_02465 [Bacteroidales bacterium]|nr:hypothetical protein [Bacteroidales bacterium]
MKRVPLLAGLLLLTLSCAKEAAESTTISGKESSEMTTIRVVMPEEAYGKVSLNDDGTALKVAWEASDKLRIFSGDNSVQFSLSRIISDHEAEFSGPTISGSSFDILYPGTYESVQEAEDDTFTPTQEGNASTAHLRYKALLKGVDAYGEIAFSSAWASSHGGSLKQAAALKLKTQLPVGVSTLKKAGISLRGKNYSLPLSNVDVSASDQTLTAYLMLPWDDISLPAGSVVPLYVMDTEGEVYSKSIVLDDASTIQTGKMSVFGAKGLTIQDFAGGDGSAENPYLIANARQLNNMHGVMTDGTFNAFRLLEDIDASSVTNWAPLNTASGFSKAMDFNGDGHVISSLTSTGATYASFSGVLNGTIRDVSFDGATISHDSKIGVVGGFIGTSGIVGNCTNVHVMNSSVTIPNSNGVWAGGFAGEINTTGTIKDCSVGNTSVSSQTFVGEFAGLVRSQAALIENCRTYGFTLSNNAVPEETRGLGGFVGGCISSATSFIGCHVDGNVSLSTTSAKIATGGFIGYNSAAAVFEDCYVVGTESAPVQLNGKAETGGFVGFNTSPSGTAGATFTGCSVTGLLVEGYSKLGGFMGYGHISGYEVPSILTNCVVDGVTVNQKLSSASGSVHTGGFAGTTGQALSFIGCTVSRTNVSATQAAVQNVGGFIGCTTYAGANFQNCSVDRNCSVTAKANSVGGFVGWAYVPDAYKSCSSAATVVNQAQGQYTGGFVGHASASASFASCIASGNVTSAYTYAGGFVGYAEASSYTSCAYEGGQLTITASGTNAQCGGFAGSVVTDVRFEDCHVANAVVDAPSAGRIGGFAGQLGLNSSGVNNISLSFCYVHQTQVDGKDNTGGFVGVQYADVTRSYVSGGKVTAHAAQCGGFSAFVQNGNIFYCYTTAQVDGGSYTDVGGFVGHLYTAQIQNCYSSGAQSGSGTSRGAFVAVCQRANGGISDCIAWEGSLPFCATNTVGATLTDCYAGTGTGSATTVSLMAKTQSWPETVWDLSGSLPVLIPGIVQIPAIFVGDSITWQWARVSKNDAQSTIISATNGQLGNEPLPDYMTLSGSTITTRFRPFFFSSHGYIDKGISGQNSTQMRERFYKDVIVHHPRIFVLMCGTNDLAQGVAPATIQDNIRFMADSARKAGIKVVLCSITPCNGTYSRLNPKNKGPHIISMNEWIQQHCNENGYSWCNYWEKLVAGDGDVANTDDIGLGLKDAYRLYDDLHPGPAAYIVMESVIQPILEALLEEDVPKISGGATLPDMGGNDIALEL